MSTGRFAKREKICFASKHGGLIDDRIKKEGSVISVILLDWDSEFFGFPVAQVDLKNESPNASVLRERIAAIGCRLCYIFSHDATGDIIAATAGARMVDRRTLLQREVSLSDNSIPAGFDDTATSADLSRLRELALQSAQFSRFRVDPAMPPDAWIRLYERWADNSLTGAMADAVLVERVAGDIAGMLTVRCCDGEGIIGLFAVDEAARGRGIGRSLLARGLAWFAEQGCRKASVVTQGDNLAALRVYERAGYRIGDVTGVHHLWLSPEE